MKTHNDALDEFFNLSSDLLCITNHDGYFLKLSRSWEILGYPLDELIGKRYIDFVHTDDLPETISLHFLLESKTPISEFRNRYRCKDGSYREIEWRFQRRNDLYYAVAHDVTEIKQTVSAFQESELRYQSVVNSMSEGIVLHAQDGSIEACNKAAEMVLGLTADQMMGRTSIDPRWRAVHEDGSPFPGDTHPAMVTLR
ncbi:MAG TPA: PAS domain S-box protein, partial [Aggregatilineales bacterium]|nr:PAS domain S-box protein [Aggregatilineales bacterium]